MRRTSGRANPAAPSRAPYSAAVRSRPPRVAPAWSARAPNEPARPAEGGMADRDSARGAAILATWPMRGAARACYTRWRERGPLAAVDAENRSLRKASTPPGPHVVTDLPLACAARQHLARARGLW